MTRTLGPAGSAARSATKDNPLADVARGEAADRLKAEAQEYLAAQAQRLLVGVGRKLGETTVRLNDIAEGNSPGFARLALGVGRKLAQGKSPLRAALELGASRAKDDVAGALRNLGGGRGGRTGGGPTVVVEYVDVGVPLRTAYDQWTRYQDSSAFAEGVRSAHRAGGTASDRQLKAFRSHRGWKARTTEQIPDDRISWTAEGAKGAMRGVVSFHRLADNLTRVLLVVEYHPRGLVERAGNLWRSQGRRARLDLKNFARYLTLEGGAGDGRRGGIRDGEVVRGHEDAVAQEREGGEREGRDADAGSREDAGEQGARGRYEGDGGYEEEEEEEGEVPYAEEGDVYAEEGDAYAEEGDAYAEEGDVYEEGDACAEEPEEEAEVEYEDAHAGRGSRR
ncbi:hypothetical protein SUDANB58_04955 [Streptomyces sp. enrichment culture]|uniref:SRPBCC family protein n=1 Tax=Streptomyces sp. enrichment culture TaxID=1795815 RepID=UPI003F54845C